MASLVTTSRMQQCFDILIDIYHGFLVLLYCCVLLEIKLTISTTKSSQHNHTEWTASILVRMENDCDDIFIIKFSHWNEISSQRRCYFIVCVARRVIYAILSESCTVVRKYVVCGPDGDCLFWYQMESSPSHTWKACMPLMTFYCLIARIWLMASSIGADIRWYLHY